MKKLISLLAFAGLLIFISCSDDDGPDPDGDLTISGIPATATIGIDETLTVPDVSLVAGDGFDTFVAAINGGAAIDLGLVTAGETSATVTISVDVTEANGFTVGNNVIVFTLSDVDGDQVQFSHVLTVTTFATISVRGEIEEDVTWTADNVYVLETRVTVVDGVTLTIEPGTVIKGEEGQGAASTALLVARGGTLNANGTAALPIIFTSVRDELTPADVAAGNLASPNLAATQNGLWGGLIVLGNASISAQNENDQDVTEVNIEGIPASDENGLYGGTDDADNSGTITYISIRHGGTSIGAGNEINGLSLGGVGSGTTINHVEIVGNQDDGIEWFGGDVDVTDVVIWNSGDDGLDTDQDWIGTCSDFFVVTPVGGSAFELDGPEGSLNRGFHTFNNGAIFAGDDIDHLVDWDGNTNAAVTNIYVYGWSTDYGFIQDEDPDEDGDQNFNPIESFGGSVVDEQSGWEYTLTDGGADAAEIFAGVDTGILSEVTTRTVGPSVDDFGWSWAGSSGALASVGL